VENRGWGSGTRTWVVGGIRQALFQYTREGHATDTQLSLQKGKARSAGGPRAVGHPGSPKRCWENRDDSGQGRWFGGRHMGSPRGEILPMRQEYTVSDRRPGGRCKAGHNSREGGSNSAGVQTCGGSIRRGKREDSSLLYRGMF